MPDRDAVRDASPVAVEETYWRGSGLLLLSSFLFCVSDVFIKLVTAYIPPGEFMVLRAVACIAVFLCCLRRAERRKALQHLHDRYVIMRSGCEAASVTCFVLALQSLPVSTVTSIYMTGPILTVCFAFALGLSAFRWQILGSAGIAFAGVLLISGPHDVTDDHAVVLGFASALLMAVRDIVTGRMPAAVPSSAVTIATMAGVGAAGALILASGEECLLPSPAVGAAIVVGALFTASGNFLVIEAFRRGDPALMSVLRYAAIPFSLLFSWLLWGFVPAFGQWVGAALVMLAAALVLCIPGRVSGRR